MRTPTEKDIQKLNKIKRYRNSLDTIKYGSTAHMLAKEKMLHRLVEEQEKVVNALVRRARAGDVPAIKEFFDRLYGKAKETIDFNQNVKFSLKDLAKEREKLQEKLEREVIDVPSTPLPILNIDSNG